MELSDEAAAYAPAPVMAMLQSSDRPGQIWLHDEIAVRLSDFPRIVFEQSVIRQRGRCYSFNYRRRARSIASAIA
jgi:hypothetical protein